MSQAHPKRKATSRSGRPRALALGACLALCALALPARAAETSVTRCAASCSRHVSDRTLRARVCGRCLTAAWGRADWVKGLGRSPEAARALRSALGDPDPQVALAAAAALAKRGGDRVEEVLSAHLAHAPAPRRAECLAVARMGALKKKTFEAWAKALGRRGGRWGRAAKAALTRCRPGVFEDLETALYGLEVREAQEALADLTVLRKVGEAAAVLDAMATRPRETDHIAAALLLHLARTGRTPPVGRVLVEGATKENQDRVNRLVAVYLPAIEALGKKARLGDESARRGAVAELAPYGPLAAPELTALLSDPDFTIRLLAARALAKAEGRTLEEAVRARVRPRPPAAPAPEAEQARWLRLYGASGDAGCRRGLLPRLAKDTRLSPGVRQAALEAYASCAGIRAEPAVRRALKSADPRIRRGAVTALESMPRSQVARRAAARALEDPDPGVRAAAVRVVTAQRQNPLAGILAGLLSDPSWEVRAEAAKALGIFGATAHARKLAAVARDDPQAQARLRAVEALGHLGGPDAVSALSHAASKDPDARVRREADRGLKGLGFGR